jgi:hypothetical protein
MRVPAEPLRVDRCSEKEGKECEAHDSVGCRLARICSEVAELIAAQIAKNLVQSRGEVSVSLGAAARSKIRLTDLSPIGLVR